MSRQPRIGFVGFGEAGFTIGHGLRSAGIESVAAYDIATGSSDRGPLIARRARESRTTLVETSGNLTHTSDIVLSTVTAGSALEAAKQTAPFLEHRHLYADLNSVSPAHKREIAAVVESAGATFVEAAVMGPVVPYGQRVPMLLGGSGATRFVEALSPFGMRLTVLPGQVGTAAAVKMCRSIVVKGLEALMVECVLGASQYDASEHVFASLRDTYPGVDWARLADYTMGRVVAHGERRAHEMEEVAATLRSIGVEPIMAEASVRRQRWSVDLGLKARFPEEGPATWREVVELIAAGRTPTFGL